MTTIDGDIFYKIHKKSECSYYYHATGQGCQFSTIVGIPTICVAFLQFPTINSNCMINATISFQAFSCKIVDDIWLQSLSKMPHFFSFVFTNHGHERRRREIVIASGKHKAEGSVLY